MKMPVIPAKMPVITAKAGISLIAAAILALLAACGSDPTAAPTPQIMPEPTATAVADSAAPEPTAPPAIISPCQGSAGGSIGDCAPEFAGTQEWINSEPLTMESLRGKVVLIDFWTYTCVNCIRTLPFLREWHDQVLRTTAWSILGRPYPGVRVRERPGSERGQGDHDRLRRGMGRRPGQRFQRRGAAYSNRYWPAKYLIDQGWRRNPVRPLWRGQVRRDRGEDTSNCSGKPGHDLSPESFDRPIDQPRDQTFMR